MKLIINYDLVNQIKVANSGINFKTIRNKMGLYYGIIAVLDLPFLLTGRGGLSPANLAFGSLWALGVYTIPEVALRNINKKVADLNLIQLAGQLQTINIYTDLEKIKQARLYKTEYSVRLEDGSPVISQNKYLMLPTDGYFNSDEVSIKQEHDMFTREYVLSMGEPKRKEQKVLSKGFIRA